MDCRVLRHSTGISHTNELYYRTVFHPEHVGSARSSMRFYRHICSCREIRDSSSKGGTICHHRCVGPSIFGTQTETDLSQDSAVYKLSSLAAQPKPAHGYRAQPKLKFQGARCLRDRVPSQLCGVLGWGDTCFFAPYCA